MNAARGLLRKFKMLDDTFLNDLAKWYQKKFGSPNAAEKPSSYTQLISQFKTRSNSIDLSDPISTTGHAGGHVDLNLTNDGGGGGGGQDTARDEEKKDKASKPKGGTTTTKSKGKTTFVKDSKPQSNVSKPIQTSKKRNFQRIEDHELAIYDDVWR